MAPASPSRPPSSWHQFPNDEDGAALLVDPLAAERAARAADRASRMLDGSRVVDPEVEKSVPRFARCELCLGDLLGRGGFADVYEVRAISLLPPPGALRDTAGTWGGEKAMSGTAHTVTDSEAFLQHSSPRDSVVSSKHSEEDAIWDDMEAHRSFLSRHCLQDKTGDARYAVKHLSASTLLSDKSYRTGAADLAVEARFLASLSHPNIIRMHGISGGGYAGFATGYEDGFFLVLDRLYETLDRRMERWREQRRRYGGFVQRRILDKGGRKKRALFTERAKVAFDVSAAIAYLHSLNVIYRDVKPENIGFDVRGDVKLFDLGLAKELQPKYSSGDGCTYKLSGHTGSLRYMAPEVASYKPYNLSADVYSFSILLWELCSLSLPYKGMGRREHLDLVVHGSMRPRVDPSWSEGLRGCMEWGWHPSLRERPSMGAMYRTLRAEVKALRGGDDAGLDQARRRSTYVLQGLPEKKTRNAMAA